MIRGLVFQLGLVAIVPLVALVPPAQGSMLLVPLGGGSANVLGWAIPAGALVQRAGPLPGSFIVQGSRAALAAPSWAHRTLMIAAADASCSPRSE